MSKVYCKNCKHLRYMEFDNGGECGTSYLCSTEVVYKEDWYKWWHELGDPQIKNKSNDCGDFEPGEPVKFYRSCSFYKVV